MSIDVARIRAGDRGTIARAITLIENGAPSSSVLLRALAADRGRAHVVGITGAPGAGKSTLVNALVLDYVARGSRIAVVAVDPSSPLTGGAVLGDRIRMGESGSDPRVFIRSLAARGHLGGVTRTTAQVVDLLDAAGFDTVIVETVGTGQSEVEIAGIADTKVVVCAPGLGDGVQAIKAGVLEIADVLVVSKGDTPLAEQTVRDLRDMLRLRSGEGRNVPVVVTAAARGDGVAALAQAIATHGTARGRGRRLDGDAADSSEAATRVARMREGDPFLAHCGVDLVEAGEGHATLRMAVARTHLNFNGTCHGGALFTLADAAFGLASNSHGALAAGIDAHIAYHLAAREGDVLIARASELARGNKVASYRVDVARADGARVASFTGTVFRAG